MPSDPDPTELDPTEPGPADLDAAGSAPVDLDVSGRPSDDTPPPFDAIVLAGGRGSRLVDVVEGTVKPEVLVGGVALVDHALAAVAGARRVVLVAPSQVARPGVVTVLEDPPDGGPVAGLAAGLAALHSGSDGEATADHDPTTRADRSQTATSDVKPGSAGVPRLVVVLACDVPHAARALPALLTAASDADVDGARLVSAEGRPQHLVAAYDRTALGSAVAALPSVRDAAVRQLVEPLHLVDVPDTSDAGADADTWDDVARLDAALTRDTIDQRTHETDGAPHE